MSKTTHMLEKEIRKIITPLLFGIVDTQHFGLVTLTFVKVVRDFDFADCYVSALTHDTDLQEVFDKNVYHIQQAVNKRLERKKVPMIRFHIDRTGAGAVRLERLLNDE